MSTPERFIIGISDWKVCKKPDILVTYALGSCVGICLYDRFTGVAGLSHIMLPESQSINELGTINRMKFADTAIVDMHQKMLGSGAGRGRIVAKIAGGALMFGNGVGNMNIGERNVIAVKKALTKLGIPILAQDTGLDYGRTVIFYSEDGSIEIKSTIKGVKSL